MERAVNTIANETEELALAQMEAPGGALATRRRGEGDDTSGGGDGDGDGTPSRERCLAEYLTELALHEYSLLSYLPSQLGACCVALALHCTGAQPLTPDIERECGEGCMERLRRAE